MSRNIFSVKDNEFITQDLININNDSCVGCYNNNSKRLSIDLEVTEDCNFACKYCIERGYFTPKVMTEDVYTRVVKKMDFILEDKVYADSIVFGFWGGEPTLNRECIEYVVNHYFGNKNISFSIFTNGLLLDTYVDFIQRVRSNGQLFHVQISYDGLPIHNVNRIDRDGNITGERTRNRILEATRNQLDFNIKSTITFKDFDKIYDSYIDICDLHDECAEINSQYTGTIAYAPTIDYSVISYRSLNDDNIKDYLQIFEEQMMKIAQNEYNRVMNGKHKIFRWFYEFTNPSIIKRDACKCSAGYRYKVINYNGDVIVCHGCLFVDSINDHYICSVYDKNKDFIDALYYSDMRFNVFNDSEELYFPKECKDCDTSICYVCNAVKYEISKKINYMNRWWDCADQPYLCQMYKIAGNIYRALHMKYKLNMMAGE